MSSRDIAPDASRPRFLALAAEWFGIVAVALLAGQFLAGLMSLVLSAETLGRLVWLPTPVAVFVLLSLRVRGRTGRFAWPGASGLWWSVVGMVAMAWLGAVIGADVYPRLFGCGGDCAVASGTGLLAGGSVLGLSALITVFAWRAAVTAGQNAPQ